MLALRDADGELGEEGEIAAVEREFIDGFGSDHLTDGGVLGLECGRFAGYLDGLGHLAGRESEIEKDALLNGDGDIAMFDALKTFEFDAE